MNNSDKRDPSERVSFPLYMTLEERRLLKILSAQKSLTMQDVIKQAIDDYLTKHKQPRIFKD
jgi:hypothetical protein